MKYPASLCATALALVAASLAPGLAGAQPDVDLALFHDGNEPCIFHTQDGVRVRDDSVPAAYQGAEYVTASGSFDDQSNCPQGSSGPPLAAVTLKVNGGTSAVTIEPGDTAKIEWRAPGAAACTYAGTQLPGAVPGWRTNGFACADAATCGAAHNTGQVTFNQAGTYTFKLTCVDPGTQPLGLSVTRTLKVEDPGGGPPPAGCTLPANLTRSTTGQISQSSGSYAENVDVTQFKHVYGHLPLGNAGADKNFPGYSNHDIKVTVAPNHYWAMEFKLGNSFPNFGTWQGQAGPAGYWRVNETLADANVWTLSISECPGDFERPASTSDPLYKCYAEYRMLGSSGLLQWAGATAAPIAGLCPLEKNKTYFLNITPHPLLGDLTGGSGCTRSSGCRGNFTHIGNFSGVNNPD